MVVAVAVWGGYFYPVILYVAPALASLSPHALS